MEKQIDLREGDLLETLKEGLPEIVLLLLDSKFVALLAEDTYMAN